MRDEIGVLYRELSRRAERHDWFADDGALCALCALRTQNVSLVTSPLIKSDRSYDGSYASLARDGDVIMGFYMDAAGATGEATLSIGGVPFRGGPRMLRPGKMTPFFDDPAVPFPIIAINYSEIHIYGDPARLAHVSVVYGFLADTARRWIATATHALPEGGVVADGYFGYASE
jgi:hypothetical protein